VFKAIKGPRPHSSIISSKTHSLSLSLKQNFLLLLSSVSLGLHPSLTIPSISPSKQVTTQHENKST